MTARLTDRLCAGALAAAVLGATLIFGAMAQEGDAMKPPDPAQVARGAKAWAVTCKRCHNLRDPKELTDEDWAVSVTHMRVRGNIPAQQARDIEAFLKSSN